MFVYKIKGNGYYDNALQPSSCAPITNASYDWRHNMIQDLLFRKHHHLYTDELMSYMSEVTSSTHKQSTNNNINRNINKNILYYDDTNIMRELWDLHKGNEDCTHYCYTPLLMQPLYEAITTVLKLLF